MPFKPKPGSPAGLGARQPNEHDGDEGPVSTGEPVGRIVRLICAAPETIAIAVAGFSMPLMVLLLADHLDWPIGYPLGVAGAAVAVTFGRRSPAPASREVAKLTLLAAALLLCWFVANCFFSAQDLYAHRDPATYDLAGRWLMDHPSLRIPTRLSWFGTPAGYNDESAGFTDTALGQVSAQGNHLLPVLLAAVGRLFGIAAMLRANLLFAAVALFALFGLARRIVGPRLAVAAVSAFAVSLPVLYVSRDTFSEPLALLFLMAGLLLLHRAISHGRTRDYALAGFVAGSAAMVRIDAYAALLALIVVAAGLLAKAPPGQRAAVGRRVAAMLAAGLVTTSTGWLDVSRLSYNYYAIQRGAILMLAKAAVALVVLGAITVLLVWRTQWRRQLASTEVLIRLARWASAVIVIAFVVLATRPFWYVGREQVTLMVIQIQKQAHHVVDSTRSYNEQTVSWQALYFGWPTVVLAAGGYVLLMRR
ncbi:MAG TPA: glycosyltransferase family 39 protein, partial [Jatrophihabitantaceae bacterium]|nr:glycosyltransferase family 39 protein [Jatrophihabitantaceae bacterium]